MGELEKLQENYILPVDLYIKVRNYIEQNHLNDMNDASQFVADLPLELRRPLSMHIYKDFYSKVDFLKGKREFFISWICPILT